MSEASIAAEVLTTISSAGSAVKSVIEAIKAARTKAKGNKEALAALLEAQDLALSLQTSIFEAKEQILALQEKNRELRAQIRQHEEWALEREKYERRKVGKSWVMTPRGEEEPYYCPTCFDAGRLVTLSALGRPGAFDTTHLCTVCHATFSA